VPLEPDEIHDPVAAAGLDGLLFFGDDLAGYCEGFDPCYGWRVVEVEPLDASVSMIAPSFEHFTRQKVFQVTGTREW
jgi:hypothetical protein